MRTQALLYPINIKHVRSLIMMAGVSTPLYEISAIANGPVLKTLTDVIVRVAPLAGLESI